MLLSYFESYDSACYGEYSPLSTEDFTIVCTDVIYIYRYHYLGIKPLYPLHYLYIILIHCIQNPDTLTEGSHASRLYQTTSERRLVAHDILAQLPQSTASRRFPYQKHTA